MASVSVERFFLFYFLLNLCLLYLTEILLNVYAAKSRLLIGAALLAFYLTGEYLLAVPVYLSLIGRGIVSVLVLCWVFVQATAGCLGQIFLFVNLLSLLVSGIFYSLADLTVLTACLGMLSLLVLLWGVFLPVYRQPRLQGGSCRVWIVLSGQRVLLRGLLDSGNLLYTPLSLLPVLVADYRALLPLFGDKAQAFLCQTPSDCWLSMLDRCDDLGWSSRLSLVEAVSVGGRKRLLSFKPDQICVRYNDGSQKSFRGAVALADMLGQREYDVLLHRDFLK